MENLESFWQRYGLPDPFKECVMLRYVSLLSSRMNHNLFTLVSVLAHNLVVTPHIHYCVTNRGIVYPFVPIVCAYIIRGAARHREIGELLNPVDVSIPKGVYFFCVPQSIRTCK